MKYLQCALQFIATILAIRQSEAVRDFIIEILDGNITVLDWDYAQSVHFNIYDQKKIYVDFILKKNITEFDIKVNFDLIKKDNRRTNLFKWTLNGCASISGALKANVMKIIYRELYRVSNIPKKCPIMADKLFYFKNYTFNDDDFPVIIPTVAWKLDADFLVGKKVKATTTLSGHTRKL